MEIRLGDPDTGLDKIPKEHLSSLKCLNPRNCDFLMGEQTKLNDMGWDAGHPKTLNDRLLCGDHLTPVTGLTTWSYHVVQHTGSDNVQLHQFTAVKLRTLLDLSVIAFRVSGNGVTHYWVEAIYTLTTLLGTGRALGILMRSHSLHSLDHYLLSTYSVQCMVPGALIQQWIVVILMLLIF